MSNSNDDWPEGQKPIHRPVEDDSKGFYPFNKPANRSSSPPPPPEQDQELSWPEWMRWLVGAALAFVMLLVTVFIWSAGYSWQVEAATLLAWLITLLVILRVIRGSEKSADEEVSRLLLEEQRASRRARRVMVDDEVLLKEMPQHPMSLWAWWLGMFVVLALVVWQRAHVLAWQLLLVAIGVFVLRILVWLHHRICFTNLRILLLVGLVNTKVPFMPLKKVTDATLLVPWHSKLLARLRLIKVRYGSLVFESAGQKQGVEKVRWVPWIEVINRRIVHEVLAPEGGIEQD
ncbi:MAG TPA: hypothetical protein VFL85_05485 [Candidatus Saccharimonadales bacterium]|nr:hypothetical protein [Candidatus Saccharimonadales bacterium]